MEKPGKNLIWQPMAILLASVVFFSILSFLDYGKKKAHLGAKPVDLFSDLRFKRKIFNPPLPAPLFSEKEKDSLGLLFKTRDRLSVISFTEKKFGALEHFLKALEGLSSGQRDKVRIAYFGDSMIEGDLLTMDLRSFFQKQFGGNGVGFVPVTSIVAGFRSTIKHGFSKDWNAYHFNNIGGDAHPLGPSGYCFVPVGGSNVQYGSSGGPGPFRQVKIFFGPGEEPLFLKGKADETEIAFTLEGDELINMTELLGGNPASKINLSFSGIPRNVYGFSFESPKGVFVDNYSFRGNSGLALTQIKRETFRAFDAHLDYKLIILHYGLNVVAHNTGNYSWYEKGLTNVVKHIKSCFPEASILLVSVNDKSYRGPEGWATEPDVPLLVETQKKVAREEGIAFWNLYENMGGYNSMVKWVEGDTVFANKDYTHPNRRGGEKIAKLLYGRLMEQYGWYNEMKIISERLD